MDWDFNTDAYPEAYESITTDEAPPPRPPIEILEYVVPFSRPFDAGQTETVRNYADMHFTFRMDVPESMAEQAAKLNQFAIPLRELALEDMEDVIICVFESGMQHCSRRFRVDGGLVSHVIKQLKEFAVQPPDSAEHDELMILRMMPVVALDRRMGVLVGYALGQMLAPEANISCKHMLFRGYAMDMNLQEVLIKSMTESLVCDVDMTTEEPMI